MQKYGLRIGSIGVEFSDRQSREKAMLAFCQGHCMEIVDYAGSRYKDATGAFSTYERESSEQMMNCAKCSGVFSSVVCSPRSIPTVDYSWKFRSSGDEEKCLCDGCYTKLMKDFELFKAKETIAKAEGSREHLTK